MTDGAGSSLPAPADVLQAIARASGHELRNALNGLVVNLEVVRAQTAASGMSFEPFMGQAIAQSEESIRLAEAAIALMLLMAKSGQARRSGPSDGSVNQVELDAGDDAERVERALAPLVSRGVVVSVERSGPTVIFRIPDDGPE